MMISQKVLIFKFQNLEKYDFSFFLMKKISRENFNPANPYKNVFLSAPLIHA